MSVDELKASRRKSKISVTKNINLVAQLMAEDEFGQVTQTVEKLKEEFKKLSSAHERYNEQLTKDDDIEQSDDYFAEIQSKYVSCLNNAKLWLKTDVKTTNLHAATDQGFSNGVSAADILNTMNLPKLELWKFDGNPLKYHSFMAIFDETVHRMNVCDKMKLARLVQYTKDKPHDAISPCMQIKDGSIGYKQARDLLHKRFGNDHLVTERIIRSIVDGRDVKSSDDLLRLSDELNNCHITLQQMNRLHEVESQSAIVKIANRLQPFWSKRWRKRALEIKSESNRYPKFEDFVDFIYQLSTDETDPVYGNLGKSIDIEIDNDSETLNSCSFFGNTDKIQPYTCVLGKLNHKLLYCDQFKAMKPGERLVFAKSNNLCHNCLLQNHSTDQCYKDTVCTVPGCGKKHTKFLHVSPSQQTVSNESNVYSKELGEDFASGVSLINANVATGSSVHLPVVGITVNDKIDTCALLDTASSQSFCTRSIVDQLGINETPVTYSLNTLSNSSEIQSSSVDMTIKSLDGTASLCLSNVYIVDKIPIKTSCADVKGYSHCKGLQFVAGGQPVHILIGQDNYEVLRPLDVRVGETGQPYACKTLFGWSLCGPDKGAKVNTNVVTNCIDVKSVRVDPHILSKSQSSQVEVEYDVIQCSDNGSVQLSVNDDEMFAMLAAMTKVPLLCNQMSTDVSSDYILMDNELKFKYIANKYHTYILSIVV